MKTKETYKGRAWRCCWLCCNFVAALLLLSACQHDDTVGGDSQSPTSLVLEAQVEQTVTRAGQMGVMDNTTLATTGFGVFIYGKNGTSDLFANQQHVTYINGDTPNTGALDDLHQHPRKWNYGILHEWTEGETYDFYAYAPYVASPSGSTGITAVTGHPDGPVVSYTVATDPAQSVDLLWGVRGETGLPWLNQTQESNGGLVFFNFRHALAAVGLHVQAMIDKENDLIDFTDVSDPNDLLGNDALKVTLQGITITPKTNSFYDGGTLDLNNTAANTPLWSNGSRSIPSLTLNSSQINSDLTDEGDMAPSAMTHKGVQKEADSQVVIRQSGGKDQFFMLLPDAAQDYEVSVDYYVTYKTGDATYKRLDYTGSKATFSQLPLVAGIRYWLNLVIGLKTVSVSVTAEDWQGIPVNIEELTERGTSANSSLSRRAGR